MRLNNQPTPLNFDRPMSWPIDQCLLYYSWFWFLKHSQFV